MQDNYRVSYAVRCTCTCYLSRRANTRFLAPSSRHRQNIRSRFADCGEPDVTDGCCVFFADHRETGANVCARTADWRMYRFIWLDARRVRAREERWGKFQRDFFVVVFFIDPVCVRTIFDEINAYESARNIQCFIEFESTGSDVNSISNVQSMILFNILCVKQKYIKRTK